MNTPAKSNVLYETPRSRNKVTLSIIKHWGRDNPEAYINALLRGAERLYPYLEKQACLAQAHLAKFDLVTEGLAANGDRSSLIYHYGVIDLSDSAKSFPSTLKLSLSELQKQPFFAVVGDYLSSLPKEKLYEQLDDIS